RRARGHGRMVPRSPAVVGGDQERGLPRLLRADVRRAPAGGRYALSTRPAGPLGPVHVSKPWGHETIWAHTDRYVGKILHIHAGQALSVQYHNRKDETVHLLNGDLIYRVKLGDELEDMRLTKGQSFRITPGTVHQMEAFTDCVVL